MRGISFSSAAELAAAVKAKTIGCRELLEYYWARVEHFNPQINAIVVPDIERARARADAADAAVARGELWGPLHGVPMTVKESLDIVGLPTTWGIPSLKDNKPAADAAAVDRLVGAGVIIFAKTNVPTLLADWQTFNPLYGMTKNPWNLTLSPGGSSGGSAAALAAGLTALEVGSDIGGSIRNPAHYCGVYGHKPSYGIVPTRGQVFPGNTALVDFFVTGPMARSASDLAAALVIMAGADVLDAPGWQLTFRPQRRSTLAEFRVAVMLDDPNSRVDRALQDRLQALADVLAQRGAVVSDRARPDVDFNEAHDVYVHLLRAATSRAQSQEVFQRNIKMAPTLAPSDRSYLARMVRGNALYHRDWLDLDEARHRVRRKWADFFDDYDLLLCPAAASAACPHNNSGERHERVILVNGEPVPTTDQLFWAGISSLPGLPATVAPIGQTPEGLPTGVQIVAAPYDDLTSIGFAQLLEREYCGFVPPPGYAD